MEAHPCEKESFLDNLWRWANEIVSEKKGTLGQDISENTFPHNYSYSF